MTLNGAPVRQEKTERAVAVRRRMVVVGRVLPVLCVASGAAAIAQHFGLIALGSGMPDFLDGLALGSGIGTLLVRFSGGE